MSAAADTNLLYAGEQFDTDAEMYYNLAWYYNPSNGLFNRVDPYAGNKQDPQSLHKYLYAHNNPINSIDPSGRLEFSLVGMLKVATVTGSIAGIITTVYGYAKGWSEEKISKMQMYEFSLGEIEGRFNRLLGR